MSERFLLQRWRTGLIVLALLIAAFLLLPHVYGNESLLFTLMTFIVLAQGLNLLYGFTGYLPFGYVGFFGCGAYATSLLVLHSGLPVLLCVVGGGLAAVVMGLILGPLLRLSGAYFSIASLAASQILYDVVSNTNLADITGGPYGLKIEQVYAPTASYHTMLVILVLATALAAWFRLSAFGMGLRAMKQDPVSAAMAGINVVRARLITWLISAGVAGLAGGAYAWNLSVFYPEAVFTLQISVFAIVFSLFGGVGTVIGPIIGASVLYSLYSVIGISTPQYFQLIYGLLIALLVLFMPGGVLSLFARRGVRVF
ncbi:branched-chain amino acid ABC transporter permease [Thiomonas bhubaneswarensis]|uniref:Amino acid/amide ABC transporter membrane protein 2, HAAT family (TC 3.A.1.4.-) n=1 Tax=Thiomonas bhubaneswarensis TaxID=339866 RepID=A0A0K6I2R4_9BURK|nr:branched-chain amino acid ABC transporter permease [Thiomonas bhubaneswarensis]CUA97425.1 amino acid/amide ABC transporter membrane protein 2, HAAT family (TC 3.A.1.4.-) [Thiomonas bhubaneswarensis]